MNRPYLWHSNYYDGALSGMIWWNGAMHWFSCRQDGDYRTDRIFDIHKINRRQIIAAAVSHLSFWLWVKKIKIGWQLWYRLPHPNYENFKTAPIVGEIIWTAKGEWIFKAVGMEAA